MTTTDAPTNRFTRNDWIALATILLLALLLRVVVASVTISANDARQFREMHGDTPGYLFLGERIARGEPYVSDEPTQANRALVRPPGYPALLAGFNAVVPGVNVWRDPRPFVWPQVAASILAVGVAFVGVRAIFRRTLPASIAAALVAINPTSVAGVAIAMPDGLHGSLFGAAFLAFVLVASNVRHRLPLAMAGGVALAAAVALKPASMYWPVFALPLLLLARGLRRATFLDAALLFVPAILVVVGWTAHNAKTTGVATYSTVAARNLRYDVVPRVNFLVKKDRFPTRKEYETGEARTITARDRADLSNPAFTLADINRRMKEETSAAFRAHPWALMRVAVDNVIEGSMVRWQRSDRQFRGEGTLRQALREIYAFTGNRVARAAWYAIVLAAVPLAIVRRDRQLIALTVATFVAYGYVFLGITTIPSEGSRLLAAAEVPAALLATITVVSVVDFVRRRPTQRGNTKYI